MTTETAMPWFTGAKKKYGLAIAAVLALCVFGAAYFICALQYAGAKKELLEMQQDELATWVAGTSEAISLWAEALETQAKRVSTAELYRMFAVDVEQLGDDAAAVNEPELVKNASEGFASLSEQVPLMRNLLLDFMNFNGLSDARIVNVKGQTLLSALTRPSPVNEEQQRTVERAVASGRLAFGPVRASQAGLVIDFADPLQAVPAQNNSDAPVAALLLSKPVTGDLAQFLARDLRQADVAKPHLVQRRGDALEEILIRGSTPLTLDKHLLPFAKTGVLPFARRTGLDGAFPVYSLGGKIPDLDWWLVLEVPAEVVDARLRTQAWMIFGIGGLLGLGVTLLLSLLWRIVVGREQRAVAQRFEALYKVIKQQKQMLDSVNISLDVGLLLVDTDGRIQMCNRAFARMVRREESELPGLNLQSVFESIPCCRLLNGVRSVVAGGESAVLELVLPGDGEEQLFSVSLSPFVEADKEAAGAVAIFQDITEARRASERRRRRHINTITALVRAVESVDPYLAGRSRMMGRLADLMGPYLSLDDPDRETIRTAADLSQMSKLFVPRELLAKAGEYSPEEKKVLHCSPDYAYNILLDVGFELPVLRAVHEMSERMDGTGYPQRLRGEAISIHARVLAVANAFCAMVNPRSYRIGMAPGEAVEKLRANADSYDRRVVDALDAVLRTPEGKLALTRTGGEENAA